MPTKTEPATAEKSKRRTGDWRGLPLALVCGAVILWVITFALLTSFPDEGSGQFLWMVGTVGAFLGIAIWAAAAIIAALRGILNQGI